MSIAKLEAAARKACQDPAIRTIFEAPLPKGYSGADPRHLRSLLTQVCAGTPLADGDAYRSAFAALSEVESAYSLRDKINSFANDPRAHRAAAADGHDLAYYLANPAQIKLALRNPKVADVLGADLVEKIGVAAIEAQDFGRQYGIEEA